MADASRPVEVPPNALEPEVLRALLEEFVTRDGTDYGERERSLDEKVARLRDAIERGEARILFDADTDSVNIVSTRELDPRP